MHVKAILHLFYAFKMLHMKPWVYLTTTQCKGTQVAHYLTDVRNVRNMHEATYEKPGANISVNRFMSINLALFDVYSPIFVLSSLHCLALRNSNNKHELIDLK